MNKTFPLPEHRCLCGKLLFKGVLFLSQVQLKCRNCGTVRIIGQRYEELGKNQYAFLAALPTEDIYSDNPSPYVVDVTDSACNILGFTREELVGREVRSLDPLMAEGAYGNLWKLIVARHFQPLSLEVYQPKKDGSFVQVRSKTIFQKAHEAMYLLTIFDLIKTVRVLPHPPSILQKPNIENMFCPFLIEIDRNLICDTVSYELASVLGYLIADIVNKPFLHLYSPSLRGKRKELIISMKKSRQSFRITKDELAGKENTKHFFESTFTVRYSDNGIFNGFIISLWPAEITKALDKR